MMINTSKQAETLSIELPSKLVLQVTKEQFEALTAANRDLQLERTSKGELIVNLPTGGRAVAKSNNHSAELDWGTGRPGDGEITADFPENEEICLKHFLFNSDDINSNHWKFVD